MSADSLSGFKDKLYWRQVVKDGPYHCFKRLEDSGGGRTAKCISLCNRHEIKRSGGQASRRPEPVLRCDRCDVAEIKRRGWDESGPTLEPRLRPDHPCADVASLPKTTSRRPFVVWAVYDRLESWRVSSRFGSLERALKSARQLASKRPRLLGSEAICALVREELPGGEEKTHATFLRAGGHAPPLGVTKFETVEVDPA